MMHIQKQAVEPSSEVLYEVFKRGKYNLSPRDFKRLERKNRASKTVKKIATFFGVSLAFAYVNMMNISTSVSGAELQANVSSSEVQKSRSNSNGVSHETQKIVPVYANIYKNGKLNNSHVWLGEIVFDGSKIDGSQLHYPRIKGAHMTSTPQIPESWSKSDIINMNLQFVSNPVSHEINNSEKAHVREVSHETNNSEKAHVREVSHETNFPDHESHITKAEGEYLDAHPSKKLECYKYARARYEALVESGYMKPINKDIDENGDLKKANDSEVSHGTNNSKKANDPEVSHGTNNPKKANDLKVSHGTNLAAILLAIPFLGVGIGMIAEGIKHMK
nr:MAG TPA: hypothetical protein [Caudoviricetes sp.]